MIKNYLSASGLAGCDNTVVLFNLQLKQEAIEKFLFHFCLLPIAFCLLHIANCILHTSHFQLRWSSSTKLLLVTCYLSLVTCYPLPLTFYFLPFTFYFLLFTFSSPSHENAPAYLRKTTTGNETHPVNLTDPR